MSLDFLTPIDDAVLGVTSLLPKQVIGKSIQVHTEKLGFPDLKNIGIALISVQESRNSYYPVLDYEINSFRRFFYQLYPGNWKVQLADLGDLPSGENPEDTYLHSKKSLKIFDKSTLYLSLLGVVKI